MNNDGQIKISFATIVIAAWLQLIKLENSFEL